MKDLFGDTITEPLPPTPGVRRPTPKKGYPAPPGTGPAGKTCKTCRNLCRIRLAKTYLKCLVIKHRWTCGPGTDILAGSPACSFYEPNGKTS